MKIKVKTDEHGESNLDEIVVELERLGYVKDMVTEKPPMSVCAYEDGTFDIYAREARYKIGKLTTLAEIRSMKIETLKEM